MQIRSVQNQTFKGYDARPIKALYMQRAPIANQDVIYKELYDIGQEEGFDVYMDYPFGKYLISDPSKLKSERKYWGQDAWSQDNKIFINKGGKEQILYPDIHRSGSNLEPLKLANKIGLSSKLSSVRFQGGNLFVGTKDNGDNYILLGADTLALNLVPCFPEKEDVYNAINEFLQGKEPTKESEEIREEIDATLMLLAKEFDVKDENVFVLKQPDFHLDMSIRPLKYPYVLVNDLNETDKAMETLEKTDQMQKEYEKYKSQIAAIGYASADDTAKKLEIFGFKPIKISGVYSDKVNFMNAIVHEKPDGTLTYITSSSKSNEPLYEQFQDTFEKELKEKYEDVKDIRFVSGGMSEDKKDSTMMSILGWLSGGLHCLVAEEPKF